MMVQCIITCLPWALETRSGHKDRHRQIGVDRESRLTAEGSRGRVLAVGYVWGKWDA